MPGRRKGYIKGMEMNVSPWAQTAINHVNGDVTSKSTEHRERDTRLDASCWG